MGSNAIFWIVAGIVVLVVIILLVVWNVNQLSRQNQSATDKRTPKPQRTKKKRDIDPVDETNEDEDELWAERRREYEARVKARNEEDQGLENKGMKDGPFERVRQAEPQRSDVFEEPVKQATETRKPEQPEIHVQRVVARVRKQKKVAPMVNAVVAKEDQHTMIHHESQRKSGYYALQGDEFSQAPVVVEQHDVESSLSSLDEDNVLRLSAYDLYSTDEMEQDIEPIMEHEIKQEVTETEVFSDLLRARLAHPRVLGWISLLLSGDVVASDQPYDEEVVKQFCSLAHMANETAVLVGLNEAREFLVRGVEGMILLVPAMRMVPGRPEYVVVFLESEEDYAVIAERLLGDS